MYSVPSLKKIDKYNFQASPPSSYTLFKLSLTETLYVIYFLPPVVNQLGLKSIKH